MTAAEIGPEPHYPNGRVDEELCTALAGQAAPEVALISAGYETAISGAAVAWSLTRPEDERTIADWRPIVIENGLCGSDEAYAALVARLAAQGYIVLSKTPPRHQRPDVAYQPHNLLHPMELQAKATWSVMRDYMRRYPVTLRDGQQTFHLLGHSMGGPVATDVAEHHPDHVASVTLIGSAGLEKHHTPKMAVRLGVVAAKELAPAVILPGRVTNVRLALASFKHAGSVLNRTGREAVQVSNHYSVPALKRLKTLGIPLYNIQPEHDHFFPYARQLGTVCLFERFIKFNVGRADHLIPQTQSELVAAVVHDLLAEPTPKTLFAA